MAEVAKTGANGRATSALLDPALVTRILARPQAHVGIYGDAHVGKSRFAATWVDLAIATGSAILIAFFDRRGKHLTYEKYWRARFGEALTTKAGKIGDTPFTSYLVNGQLVARIMFFATQAVEETDGVSRLKEYWEQLEKDIAAGRWIVFVLDSATFMSLDARKEAQYITNPKSKSGKEAHGMQWYGSQTDAFEDMLCCQIPNLNCSTLTIMHESKTHVEAEGIMVRAPFVPGKRLVQSNMIAATFPELYHLSVQRDEAGKKVRRLQTDSDEAWQAGTVIGAPDGCGATYQAIWKGWEKA